MENTIAYVLTDKYHFNRKDKYFYAIILIDDNIYTCVKYIMREDNIIFCDKLIGKKLKTDDDIQNARQYCFYMNSLLSKINKLIPNVKIEKLRYSK